MTAFKCPALPIRMNTPWDLLMQRLLSVSQLHGLLYAIARPPTSAASVNTCGVYSKCVWTHLLCFLELLLQRRNGICLMTRREARSSNDDILLAG